MTQPLNEKQLHALFERGNNFVRLGNLTAALKDYDLVIQHNPSFAPAYFNRGFARQHGAGDLEGAIQDYMMAVKLKPHFPEALVNCAIAHTQQGDYEEALADYSAALAQNPQFAQAYVNRGEVHFIIGDFNAAAADFRHALSLKAGYRYAIAGLAVSLHALGDSAEALQLWQGLIARNEQFKDVEWVRSELGWHEALVQQAAQLLGQ